MAYADIPNATRIAIKFSHQHTTQKGYNMAKHVSDAQNVDDGRVSKYDFLRFISMICIILAHIGPGQIIFQIRNFDVPLMVLLSGISFSLFTESNYSKSYLYIWNRFTRLVVPTWLFLLIWFTFQRMVGINHSFEVIVKSILLADGCGWGIWIIRIFFITSLLAPLVRHINRRVANNNAAYAIIIALFATYIAACDMYNDNHIATQYIAPIVPYTLIFWYGVRISNLSGTKLIIHFFFFITIFFALEFYSINTSGHFKFTQPFKYPPMPLYLSYSLAISTLLLIVADHIPKCMQQNFFVKTIGASTLWFYFWHWIVLYFIMPCTQCNSFTRLICTLCATFVIVFTQRKACDYIFNKSFPRYTRLGKIFTC